MKTLAAKTYIKATHARMLGFALPANKPEKANPPHQATLDLPLHGDDLEIAAKIARIEAADGQPVAIASDHHGAVFH